MIETKSISEINEYVGSSVNPLATPEQMYELYSVPSFESGYPEVISGADIGSTKVTVEEGDVLICKINPRINRVWVVRHNTEFPLLASSEWIVIRNRKMNSAFLRWYFSSPKFRMLLTSQVTGMGGSLTRAQPKQVAKYPVPILLREKQDYIAKILDKVELLIEKRNTQLTSLDELVKSRFIELFGDIKELGIRWGEKAFKEVTYNLDSKRKPVKDADRKKMQGKYPYYGATGIVDHVNEYRQEGVFLLISEDGKALEFRNKPIAFIAEGKIWVNNHAHVQQCKPECNMIYLMYYINLIDISAWVTGIDQKKLNRENLDSIPVALPPVDIQEQFATFVVQVDKSKFAVQKALDETQTLFDSLMQKYFG